MSARTVRVLVIAGHDPSGAGIDADRAALASLHFGDVAVEALAVTTARTQQDARGVHAIGARHVDEWLAEAERFAARDVHAVKFGLLPGEEHIAAAASFVRRLRTRFGRALPVVLDPVIAASSGGKFLDEHGIEALRGELIGEGVIVTPNLSEAATLARLSAKQLAVSLSPRVEAARILIGLGARAVVVKGGHGAEDPVRDLVLDEEGQQDWLAHPRIPGGKIRGSGCRFASRLAAGLAAGLDLRDAALGAAKHVTDEISRSVRPAGG